MSFLIDFGVNSEGLLHLKKLVPNFEWYVSGPYGISNTYIYFRAKYPCTFCSSSSGPETLWYSKFFNQYAKSLEIKHARNFTFFLTVSPFSNTFKWSEHYEDFWVFAIKVEDSINLFNRCFHWHIFKTNITILRRSRCSFSLSLSKNTSCVSLRLYW